MKYKSEKAIRKSMSSHGVIAVFVVVGSLIFMGISLEYGVDNDPKTFIIGCTCLAVASIYIMLQPKNGYADTRKVYDEEFLVEFLPDCFEQATYAPHGGIDIPELVATKLINTSQNVYSYNLLTGEQNGNPFKVAGVRTPLGFMGYFVIIDYLLLEDVDITCFSSDFVNRPEEYQGGLNSFRIDNQKFNIMFDTYTTTEEAAKRFFTPSLVNGLIELYRNIGDIAIRFVNNKIYIAVNSEKEGPFWIDDFLFFSPKSVKEEVVIPILRILDITKNI